ncbi:MAG: acyl-CoA dehydrogenase, partial [Dehalococcoidia bacterium]
NGTGNIHGGQKKKYQGLDPVGQGVQAVDLNLERTLRPVVDGSEDARAFERVWEGVRRPRVAEGDAIMCLALSEPVAEYKPEFMGTAWVRAGEDFQINGTKLFVPYAGAADYLLAVAATGEVSPDGKGMSIFLVRKGTEGMGFVPLRTVAADRLFEVTFDQVLVSPSDVVGEMGAGWEVIDSTLRQAIALQCAETVGVMQQALSMTAEYTSTRYQFGQPIGKFQAVQHRLADMLTDVEGARWTSYQAITLLNKGGHAGREVAIAKAWTADACQRVAYAAQHLHGGVGVDLDYDLHFYFEWAKSRQLNLGPAWYHLPQIEPIIRS